MAFVASAIGATLDAEALTYDLGSSRIVWQRLRAPTVEFRSLDRGHQDVPETCVSLDHSITPRGPSHYSSFRNLGSPPRRRSIRTEASIEERSKGALDDGLPEPAIPE